MERPLKVGADEGKRQPNVLKRTLTVRKSGSHGWTKSRVNLEEEVGVQDYNAMMIM